MIDPESRKSKLPYVIVHLKGPAEADEIDRIRLRMTNALCWFSACDYDSAAHTVKLNVVAERLRFFVSLIGDTKAKRKRFARNMQQVRKEINAKKIIVFRPQGERQGVYTSLRRLTFS